ncbi:MAG: tetratricopeptide repeat protein [Cyanobacteria bacterium P01_G01_bin.54]
MGIVLSAASRKILTDAQARQRNYDGEVWKNLDLAEAAGVSEKTVERCLKGKNISEKTIAAIAQALGVGDLIPELNPNTSLTTDTPNPIPTNLFRYRRAVPKFVGRDVAMQELSELLQKNETVAIAAAVFGMGGLGKTELAWQWAYQQYEAEAFPGGVVWLDMAAGNPGEQLTLFCQTEFEVELPELPTLEERVAHCWQHWAQWRHGAVLVVLDDLARDRDGAKLKMLQPGSDKFRVVWTTREQWTGIRHYPLNKLSKSAARELLASYIDKARLDAEPEALEDLLVWFDGLPLGLELAARYLAMDKFLPIADYVAELSLTHESLTNKPDEMDYPHGVEAALVLSWGRLKSEAAQHLALRLGLYGTAPIPLTEEEQKKWRDSFRQLVNLSLVEREVATQVRLHPLVRQFVQKRLVVELTSEDADALRREVAGGIVAQGKQIPYPITKAQVQKFAPWIPHLEEVTGTLLPWLSDEDVIAPLSALDEYYDGQGLYKMAEPWSIQCVAVAQERLGNQHPDTAEAISNLAGLYRSQGRYTEAEPLHLKALNIARQSLPPNHPDLAINLNNLALLYQLQKRYSEAETLFLEALEIDRQSLPPTHLNLATHLNNLAGLYDTQGKYTEAETRYQKVLDIVRASLPPDHPSLATSLNNLANSRSSQEKFNQALLLHKEAVEVGHKGLDDEHPTLALFEINLACCYQNLARYSDAEPLMLKAMQVLFNSLGEDHPQTQKQWNRCLDFYRTALAAGLPDTRLNQHPLGDLIRSQL